MSHDTAIAYLDTLTLRLTDLDDAMIEMRRQSIRGFIFLMIPDPTHREEAIIAAHAAGLMTSPFETMKADMLAAIAPWLLPTKKEISDVQ